MNKPYNYDLWIGCPDAESEKAYQYSVNVNKPKDVIQEAYDRACEKHQIAFHSDTDLDEESTVYGSETDGIFGEDALQTLYDLGIKTGQDIGIDDQRTLAELDDASCFRAEVADLYIALLFKFITLELPDLEYEISNTNDSLFENFIGHGMIYT